MRGRRKGFRAAIAIAAAAAMLVSSVSGLGILNSGSTVSAATVNETLTEIEDFELSEVLLTDDYYTNASEKEIEYLLSFDADRLLANFRKTAGIETDAECYGGWEDSLIGGHTMGHYMTALVQAYESANTTEAQRQALLEMITTLTDGLKECQDKIGTGFIFGSTSYKLSSDPEFQFDNVEANKTNITTQAWVPWYTMHKIMEGLVEVANIDTAEGAEVAAEAKEVVSWLGDWVYERTSKWTTAIQTRVLNIEYGGMNDVLYDLYKLTGNENHLTAAHMFDETALFTKVLNASAGDNVLDGLHANTTIPKFLGALNRYTVTGEAEYLAYAEAFWELVVNDHTYVTGGNSEWEHFGADDILDAERTNCNCETCNAYNMLKMTKLLFQITGDKKYADYYENTFLNSVLSSQNPETGMTTYFQPMATGYFKVYSSEFGDFWCCTGSGMENFTKLGTGIYYHKDNKLIVNEFISSEVTFAEANAVIAQETDIPNTEEAVYTVSAIDSSKAVDLELWLRIPDWAAGDVVILVNGAAYSADITTGGYAVVEGLSAGDTVSYTVPMEVVAYTLPDNENVFAFKYGPVVLSAELGTENMTQTTTGVSVAIPASKNLGTASSETLVVDASLEITRDEFIENINEYLVRDTSADELAFTLTGTDTELTFTTHYMQHTQRYGIYWYITSDDDAIISAQVIAQKEADRADATTLDSLLVGYGQYENDDLHDMAEENSVSDTSGTASAAETFRYAEADGYFAYDVAVNPSCDNYLQLYFLKEDLDDGKTIQITVGDTVVFGGTLAQLAAACGADTDEDVFLVEALLSEELLAAEAHTKTVDGDEQTVVTVTFASANSAAETVYFVDCGDYDTSTVSDGDALGTHNSVTEQVYGEDPVTGYTWGIMDTVSNPLTNGSSNTGGVDTDRTWPNEWDSGDNLDKTRTFRYTKNQYEHGIDPRYLDYGFELEAGTYEIEVGLSNPWNCSTDPAVYLNYGESSQITLTEDAAVPAYGTTTVTGTFTVEEDGVTTLNLRGTGSSTLAINITYITITESLEVEPDSSARICNLLSVRTAYGTNAALAKAEASDTENVTVDWDGVSDEISVTVSSDTKEFALSLAPADKYGYVSVDGYAIDDTKEKTFAISGRTAAYTIRVYAEDHETYKDYTLNVLKSYEVDEDVVYFVDCGDYDTSTVSSGDAFGTHNSVTEQVYGADPVTGYNWGVVDDDPTDSQGGHDYNNSAFTDNTVFTGNTWAYEYNSADGIAKEASNRYTKNQYENGIATRYLDYAFELENGTYEVEIGFSNPWSCSTNPAVYANIDTDDEVVITEDAKVPGNGTTTVTGTVTVTNGKLTLNMRGTGSTTLAINVTYIIIRESDGEEVETPEYETIYFVDCGDYDTSTVSDGDTLGTHNSVTEQVYGVDSGTGYTWGIMDTVSDPLVNASSGTGGVDTDWSWPYESNSGDGVSKTQSNRYTKNQYENGIETRYLDYGFELEAGTYEIEIGFSNPWGCSDHPAVYLNLGTDSELCISEDVNVPDYGSSVVKAEFTVDEDGITTLNIRGTGSDTLAINLSYIIIRQEVVDETEEPEEPGSESESESETESEPETESEIESESETETESEIESEIESEFESTVSESEETSELGETSGTVEGTEVEATNSSVNAPKTGDSLYLIMMSLLALAAGAGALAARKRE